MSCLHNASLILVCKVSAPSSPTTRSSHSGGCICDDTLTLKYSVIGANGFLIKLTDIHLAFATHLFIGFEFDLRLMLCQLLHTVLAEIAYTHQLLPSPLVEELLVKGDKRSPISG